MANSPFSGSNGPVAPETTEAVTMPRWRARVVCLRCNEKKVGLKVLLDQNLPLSFDVPDLQQTNPRQSLPPAQRGVIRHGTDLSDSIIPETGDGQSEHQHRGGLSPNSCAQASYLGESGYMPVFSQLRGSSEARMTSPKVIDVRYIIHPLQPTLQLSYLDTFVESCYCFCPILDRTMLNIADFGGSLLLQQALALVGSIIQPSLLHGDDPTSYYDKARVLFYHGAEPNPLVTLVAAMLFYWWSTCPPNVVSTNGSWWWSGITIRQAQELGFHREPKADQGVRVGETVSLRRRIWWTLFARERLTSICHGRPCIINPQDCDVRELTHADFPDLPNARPDIFIQWIRLCTIVGRVGEHLRRSPQVATATHDLLDELKGWAHSLPPAIQLPFSSYPTPKFDRDIYQLHLPYLTCITLLYLKRSSKGVPTAHVPAILAASSVARIFEDILIRGSLRFLQGMAGWYIAIALLALLYARRVKTLEEAADTHFQVLRVALKEMAHRFASAKMYDKGIDKLLEGEPPSGSTVENDPIILDDIQPPQLSEHPSEALNLDIRNREDPLQYFPWATQETSPLFKVLLFDDRPPLFSPMDYANDVSMSLFDLFGNPLEEVNYDQASFPLTWEANNGTPLAFV
ncbi:hypothetical protein B7463_g7787, partial [Scytalidium lignicola]